MSVQESGIEAEDSELSGEELREQHLMASKLKRLREARGLTRAELVAKVGAPFTEKMIAEYETGDIPMEATRILVMMKALNVAGEAINPKRLLADHLLQTGYGKLTKERRRSVDLLASALMEDQAKEVSRENNAD